MRVFVNRCDGYVGRVVGAAFADAGHELTGTLLEGAAAPEWLTEAVATDDEDMQEPSALRLLLTADVVVLELEGCEVAARKAAMAMANQRATGKEKVLIGISSPMTWAGTSLPDSLQEMPSYISEPLPPALNELQHAQSTASDVAGDGRPGTATSEKPPTAASDVKPGTAGTVEAEGQGAADVEDGAHVEAPPLGEEFLPEAFAPMPLSGFDYERRQGAPVAAALTAAENCILRAARKKKLLTYIVCPGILYGNGERDHLGLHEFFKAAYECQPLRMYGSGANWLPMMHVADLGTYCVAVTNERPANQQYLLAADEQIATFGAVVQEISGRFGVGTVAPVPYEEVVFNPEKLYLQLNLPFRLTWGDEDTAPVLKYSQGLLSCLDDIYNEYLSARNLFPLRILLRGGPASGKSHLAARLASLYGLRHVDVKAILEHRHSLPADDELRMEVEAQLSSKEGRVSEKNLALLAYKLLTEIRVRHKGYVLDGFPRSLGTSRWLLTRPQEMSEEELAAWREEQAAAAEASGGGPPAAKATGKAAPKDNKGGKDANKGAGGKGGKTSVSAEAEPPTNHPRVPATEVMPDFAITLDVAEEVMAERTAKLFAAEQEEVKRLIAEGKIEAKKPPPPSHHCDKDFQRRLAAWKTLREVDESDLANKVNAVRAAYDAAFAEYEAKKAEVEAAQQAAEEAAAAAAEAGEDGQQTSLAEPPLEVPEMPEPPEEPTYPKYGGLDELLQSWGVHMTVMDGWPKPEEVEPPVGEEGEMGEEGGSSRRPTTTGSVAAAEDSADRVLPMAEGGRGSVGFQIGSTRRAANAAAGDAAAISRSRETTASSMRPVVTPVSAVEEGDGLAGLSEAEKEAEIARLAAEDSAIRSAELIERVKSLLGVPRNYEGFPLIPDSLPAVAVASAKSTVPAATIGAPSELDTGTSHHGTTVCGQSMAAPGALALLDQRTLAPFLAARHADRDRMSAPILKYLVDRVMPTISRALVEVSRVRPEKPLEFVGNFLLDAGQQLNDAYHDPYDTDAYTVQAEKIRKRAERDRAREEERAAKDAREAELEAELDAARTMSRKQAAEMRAAELAALAEAAAEIAGRGGGGMASKKEVKGIKDAKGGGKDTKGSKVTKKASTKKK